MAAREVVLNGCELAAEFPHVPCCPSLFSERLVPCGPGWIQDFQKELRKMFLTFVDIKYAFYIR